MALAVSKNQRLSFLKNLRPFDWFCLMLGLGAIAYYASTAPYTIAITAIIFGTLYPFIGIPFVTQNGLVVKSVTLKIPYTNYKITVKIWHVLSLALALSWILIASQPSHAFFLVTAQDKLRTVICAATATSGSVGVATGGGGSTITGNTACNAAGMVVVIFDAIRIVVTLAVVGGIIAIIVQSQREQDVKPAAMFVGVVVGSVLIVEALSRWLLT